MNFKVAFIIFTLSFYGCGSDDSNDSSDETSNAGTTNDVNAGEMDANGNTSAGDMSAGDDQSGCGTVHTVTTTDDRSDQELYMDFSPENLTISAGDCVNFVMSNTHNAIEVSQETYDSRGFEALDGGFEVGFGETKEIRFDEPGTHYYICLPHVYMDMIGTITVE